MFRNKKIYLFLFFVPNAIHLTTPPVACLSQVLSQVPLHCVMIMTCYLKMNNKCPYVVDTTDKREGRNE